MLAVVEDPGCNFCSSSTEPIAEVRRLLISAGPVSA